MEQRAVSGHRTGHADTRAEHAHAGDRARAAPRERRTAERLELDADQRAADRGLAVLLDRRGRPRRGSGGVYLHGPPGRGKTMLMDRFFAAARTKGKRRWHFHEFFAHLHAAAATTGTIGEAIAGLVGDAELVCFDEFHVHDIGDAVLVARLLDAVFARGVPLVVTSNYPPAELLPNPLFHERFLPTITRIEDGMTVVEVAGRRDYRKSVTEPASGTGFARGEYLLGPPPPATGTTVVRVGSRGLTANTAVPGILDADFADLCGANLSAADYVDLAARFDRWVVRGVPRLGAVPLDRAMRWVNLIDVLYDADRTLTVYADAPIDELAEGVAAVAGLCDLGRTISRLYEISHPGAAIAG